ncbi:MAG: NADH-quinone oxidoreductase subunit J [Terriglobia bacterium]
MAPLFYILAALAILAALSVVLQRTPAYSALSLIVVLCSLAVVYLLLGAEFLAVVQVIIYAGAIMVLFVLVIMLLNARQETPTDRSRLARWLGAPLLVVFLGEIFFAVWQRFPPETIPAAPVLVGGPRAVGELLFRNYVLPFELTSILILVAVLGAVVLAKKEV